MQLFTLNKLLCHRENKKQTNNSYYRENCMREQQTNKTYLQLPSY